MFIRTCRFQRTETSHKSIEVDEWGHGVRLRWLDNMTGEARSIFLDAIDTSDLAEMLGEYTGISQLASPPPTDARISDANLVLEIIDRIARGACGKGA